MISELVPPPSARLGKRKAEVCAPFEASKKPRHINSAHQPSSDRANMDIAALVNPQPEGLLRRSSSGTHNGVASSPITPSVTLPTRPPSSSSKVMTGKRKRHDPKPIWAFREDETDSDGNTFNQYQDKLQKLRPQPATPQQPLAPPQARPHPPAAHNSALASNGSGPKPPISNDLTGYARPVSDDAEVYDEVSRKVCDFIWTGVIDNPLVRKAISESEGTQIEVEARWGQMKERDTGMRIQGVHMTETVINPGYATDRTKFESTMTMEQHKRMNGYLNNQVQKSASNPSRARVDYKHTREIDQLYELNQEGFSLLPPAVREIVQASKRRPRVRVTRDAKEPSKILNTIIKTPLENLEISSPQTEWDYRIGVNLEIKYPGPIDNLVPVVEQGKSIESMKRYKDRVSYSWLNAYQIDLTQVRQGDNKNHELEFELDSDVLLKNGDHILQTKQPSNYENLIKGMMNNLRVMSREITPQ
ncbi:unnamed protein product [Periconia digitata]|uniref:mRNA-capping enzyme subunit beta n=1 Tax=Periconia digitata TaxID=1303443 RepID=A0A9W4UJP9_9PLEO|nr:unnamed protein product [Periconia digitata]